MVAEPVHARPRGAGTPRGDAAPDPQPLMLPPTGPTRGLSAGPADGWGGRRGEVGRREGPPGIDPAVTGQHQLRYCVAEPVRALLCGAGDPPEDPAAPPAPHQPRISGSWVDGEDGYSRRLNDRLRMLRLSGRYASLTGSPRRAHLVCHQPEPPISAPTGAPTGCPGQPRSNDKINIDGPGQPAREGPPGNNDGSGMETDRRKSILYIGALTVTPPGTCQPGTRPTGPGEEPEPTDTTKSEAPLRVRPRGCRGPCGHPCIRTAPPEHTQGRRGGGVLPRRPQSQSATAPFRNWVVPTPDDKTTTTPPTGTGLRGTRGERHLGAGLREVLGHPTTGPKCRNPPGHPPGGTAFERSSAPRKGPPGRPAPHHTYCKGGLQGD